MALVIAIFTLVQPVGADPDATYDDELVDQLLAVLKFDVADPFVYELPLPAQYKIGNDPQDIFVVVVADPFKGDTV